MEGLVLGLIVLAGFFAVSLFFGFLLMLNDLSEMSSEDLRKAGLPGRRSWFFGGLCFPYAVVPLWIFVVRLKTPKPEYRSHYE